MLRGAAVRHRLQFERMLAQTGDSAVVVRQPLVRSAGTSAADRVLGKRAENVVGAGYGVSTTITAVVSDAAMALNDQYAKIPPQIAALGRTETLAVILRCLLSDVLVDPDLKYGKTIFDTAKDVQIGGGTFQVRAVDRTGLPPEGPYICWVALRVVAE